MADSSDDEVVTGQGKAASSKPHRARAIWENLKTKNHDLGDDVDANIEGVLGGIEEANKRRRYAPCILSTMTCV